MPRKALPPPCNDKDRQTLREWAASRSMEARLVERARMISKLLDGASVSKVATDLKVHPNTIIDWRNRFAAAGVAGLYDRPRSGKPPKYDQEFCARVLQTLEQPTATSRSVLLGRPGQLPGISAHLMMQFGVCFESITSVWPGNEVGVSALILNLHRRQLILSGSTWPHLKKPW